MDNFYSSCLKYLFTGLFACCIQCGWAQVKTSGSVSGQVISSRTKLPLEYAIVSVLKDTVVVDNAVTGKSGEFKISVIAEGSYTLRVAFLGHSPFKQLFAISAANPSYNFSSIGLEESSIKLNDVVINGEKAPVTLKQDTVEFNAGSFKTRENAIAEDLLKKLPGVEVDNEGNIKAHGEKVSKVTVDGKEFFGNDPKIATKNLPADIIDKVQVIDKKSDQAEFTKIDDGQREKVINFTIKEDKKKGVFGNASVGGGSDSFTVKADGRFDGNLNLNRFSGKQQLSLILNGNNTNKSSFSLQDLAELSGNSMLTGMGGGGGAVVVTRVIASDGGGSSFGPPGGGITTTGSGGLNFSDTWGKGFNMNGSYFANYSRAENETDNNRTNLLANGNSYYNALAQTENNRRNHRLNLNIDYKIDEKNSIRVTPNLGYNMNGQGQNSSFTSLNNALNKINDGSRINSTDLKTPSFVNNMLYRHSFAKNGRTISLNLASTVNSSATDAYNQSTTNYYAVGPSQDIINQYIDQSSNVNNQTLKVSYTEPITRSQFLELNYSYTNNYSKADRKTYNFNPVSNQYADIDPLLSNIYNNTFVANQFGFNIRTVKKKWSYTAGVALQQTNLTGEASNLPSAIDKNFLAVLPSANLNAQFSQNRRLSVNYRSAVRQPTISQLQPVPDNSNPLNIRNGNPDLKPEYNNNINVNYTRFDMATNRSTFAFLTFQQTNNRIATKVILDEATGKRVSTPVNVDGNWFANGNLSFGVPFKKLKTSINFNSGISARHDINFTNNDKNITNAYSLSQGFSWSYSYKEKFDFYASANANYNRTGYSLPNLNDLNYYNYAGNIDLNYNLKWNVKAGATLNYVSNMGRGEGYNKSVSLIGASLQKEMLSKKQAVVRLQVNDLFNNNLSVNRNVTENSIEDVRTNSLQRYFLLSFSYKLNKFGVPQQGPMPVGNGGPVIIMRQ